MDGAQDDAAVRLVQAQLMRQHAELEHTAGRLNRCEEAGEAARAACDAATARADALDHALAETQSRADALAAEIARLSETLEAREAELRHLYGSRTFRWTAPLRRLAALLRGG